MNKREKIIGIVLLIVAITWMVKYLPGPAEKNAAPVPVRKRGETKQKKTAAPQLPTRQLDLDTIIEQLALKGRARDTASFRDPFQKIVSEVPQEKTSFGIADLQLTGIIWEQDEPLVLIGGELRKEGDTILNFVIKEIRPKEVVITRGLEKYILKILDETITGQ